MTESGKGGLFNSRVAIAFVVGAMVGAISAVEVAPNYTPATAQQAAGSTDAGNVGSGATGGGGSTASGPVGSSGSSSGAIQTTGPAAGGQGLPPARQGLECATGRNGGATDQGVTATSIRMATTVAESGIGAAFLGEVRFGIEAVRNAVNRAGGICGRKISIDYIDDGWDAQKGAQFIRNFLPKVFAIPVGPSSEGLRVAITSGDIDRARVPVPGADGLLIDQYTRKDGSAQPWVWPVAAATVASARAMANNAYESGAKTFGIVFDKNYRFGQEAAKAFNSEVKRLTKSQIDGFNPDNNCQRRFCGIQAGQSSYSNEVIEYYKTRVDFTALFLEPQTALVWMADPNTPSAKLVRYGGAQPLFTRDFATNCQSKCDQMTLWTGFKPYIESHKNNAAVRKFVADLQRTNPQADIYNQFTLGGYLGMEMLVEALRRVGPDLTRARFKAAFDTMSVPSGLTFEKKLSWRPNWRYVNTTLQAFTIQYKGTFGGWREGPVERDPHPAAGTE